MTHIASGEVVWASNGKKLEDHSGKNVQHRAKGGVHKGNDGTSTAKILFLLGQDVAGRELTSLSNSPWIRPAVLVKKLIDQS